MFDFIFGLLPEVYEVNIFPPLFVALTTVGIMSLFARLIHG